MSEFLSTAEAIAREAGVLLRDFYRRGVRTEYKGDVDLVTEADRASEALIGSRLRAAFPDHGIYGEEGTREGLDGEFRWYVDPLDGTTNFAHGFPAFCVVLGCEHRPAGLAANQGATLNGEPIHVSRTHSLAESLIATGFPSKKRHNSPNVHFYQEFTLRSHGVRRAGSAALDLAYVACGRLDGYWEFQLNPWDTSAGYLLLEEAGGRITHFDGSKFTLDSREILASNGLIHPAMEHLFADMFAGRNLDPILTPAEFAARRAERS